MFISSCALGSPDLLLSYYILLLPYSITTSALGSPALLPPYSSITITIALHNTHHTNNNPYPSFYSKKHNQHTLIQVPGAHYKNDMDFIVTEVIDVSNSNKVKGPLEEEGEAVLREKERQQSRVERESECTFN